MYHQSVFPLFSYAQHKLCQPRYWPPIHQISSTSTSPTILSLLCAFPVLPGKFISTISFKMLRGKCIQHAHRHTHHTYSTHRGLIHVQVNLASTQPACLQPSLLQAVQPVSLSPHGCQPNLGTLDRSLCHSVRNRWVLALKVVDQF